MLPEDVQALLGGMLFFILASLMLIGQKVKAQDLNLMIPTNPIEIVQFLK